MGPLKMSFVCLRLSLWRVWDFVVKSIWSLLPDRLKNLFWHFIASKNEIRAHVENCLKTSDGVVIQVGSNDGVSNDPLYDSILSHKRESFLVEPIDYLVDRLRLLHKENFFVTICDFAIHPHSDRVDFFHLVKDADRKMGDLWKP
jgi:hypothetical protein